MQVEPQSDKDQNSPSHGQNIFCNISKNPLNSVILALSSQPSPPLYVSIDAMSLGTYILARSNLWVWLKTKKDDWNSWVLKQYWSG